MFRCGFRYEPLTYFDEDDDECISDDEIEWRGLYATNNMGFPLKSEEVHEQIGYITMIKSELDSREHVSKDGK